MKKIILFIYLTLFSISNLFSQNAFSDAIMISKNKDSYLSQISNLIKVAPLNVRQRDELINLEKFLINPWDTTIKSLNFKIVSEIPHLIGNLEATKKNLKELMNSLKTDMEKKVELLKDKQEELKNSTKPDTAGLSLNSNSASLDSLIEYNRKDKFIKDLEFIEIPNLKTQIQQNDSLLNQIDSLNSNTFEDFKNNINNNFNSINILGKDNNEEIKETVSNSNFSLSQAAIIDAVGNAIIEQVKEGLVNSLFQGVLEKDIYLNKPTSSNNGEIIIEGTKYKLIDSISYYDDYGYLIDSVRYKITKTLNSKDTIYRTVAYSTKLKSELRIFFPNTIKILEKLRESKTNNYFTNLNITLKNSFSEDLKNILENITCDSNILQSKIFKTFFYSEDGKKKEVYDYLSFAVFLTKNIKNGFHPIELLPILHNYLSNSSNINFKNYANYILLIDVLQKNLREITSNSQEIWINITNFEELNTYGYPGSLSSAEYFMAIIYQYTQFKEIKNIFSQTEFPKNEFDKLKVNLITFSNILRSIEKNIDELKNGNQKSFNDYSQYLNNFLILLDSTNGLLGNYFFDKDQTVNFTSYINNFRTYSNYSIDIYKSITNGSYSKILPVILNVFNNQFTKAEDQNAFKNEIIRYTNLYVDISTANSQEALNLAISKAAHNSGGYLRKAEEDFTVSIDSYPGLFVSSENINNANGEFNFGFSVPIGFNFQINQFGLYLQAFDIAAAVNYRFSNDSTTNLPSDVTFQQVFSPGVFFVINPIKTFPLSFNIGVSVTPALREVNGSGIILSDSKSTFYGVNISYNVPLWYLY